MIKPVVAIVGRPNVGKSTFFNRCVGSRASIVDDSFGVTRDRIYREVDWSGRDFILVDTGGIVSNSKEEITTQVKDQAYLAIEEADVIIFMVDGKNGLSGADRDVANLLRKTKKPVILAANKIDEPHLNTNLSEFYQLGIGEPYCLSALRGSGGVGDLLDLVISHFPKQNIPETVAEISEEEIDLEKEPFSIAIIGKPNVGKSSAINILCGTQRSIVSSTAGTTRDAIDTTIKLHGRTVNLIDTAGIRRKSKVDYGVEAFSVVRSLSAISRADVVVLMLDATEPISDQDQKIAAKIEDAGKAAVIVFNKWDLIEDRSSTAMNQFKEDVKTELRQIAHAEVIFTSALTRKRLIDILDAAAKAFASARKRVNTSLINQVINEATALVPPPSAKRSRRLRIYYATQASAAPPTFILFVNDDKLLTPSYSLYLERKIREAFGFIGSPIRLILREKNKDNK